VYVYALVSPVMRGIPYEECGEERGNVSGCVWVCAKHVATPPHSVKDSRCILGAE